MFKFVFCIFTDNKQCNTPFRGQTTSELYFLHDNTDLIHLDKSTLYNHMFIHLPTTDIADRATNCLGGQNVATYNFSMIVKFRQLDFNNISSLVIITLQCKILVH